jgi:hypothetical protein
MSVFWTPQLNALLGGAVIAVGAWLAMSALSPVSSFLVFVGAVGVLLWRGRTIGLVWAWTTLILGIESFAWPLVTMIQIRSITAQPTDEQMGTILSAVLMGVFSAVFWIAFSYGLFRRAVAEQPTVPHSSSITPQRSQSKR